MSEEQADKQPLAEAGKPTRQPGVLIVEDDPQLLEMNRRILQREGFRVFEATSEQAALWSWQRHSRDIDLVFTDVMIPDRTTGIDLVRRLRQQRPKLCAVYTSGFGPEMGEFEITGECYSRFLQKPYTVRKMIDTVLDALDLPLKAAMSKAEITRSTV